MVSGVDLLSLRRRGQAMRLLTAIFMVFMMSPAARAQATTFAKEGVDYVIELPSPRWRAVRRVDVHEHFDFVNGEDRADGYLRVRKNLVEAGTTVRDLYLRDEANWKLLPGYVGC